MGCGPSKEDTVPVKEDIKPTENIKKIKSLGKGNFGEVFLIKSKLEKKKSALKEMFCYSYFLTILLFHN